MVALNASIKSRSTACQASPGTATNGFHESRDLDARAGDFMRAGNINSSLPDRPRMDRGWFTPIQSLRLVLLQEKLLVALLQPCFILCCELALKAHRLARRALASRGLESAQDPIRCRNPRCLARPMHHLTDRPLDCQSTGLADRCIPHTRSVRRITCPRTSFAMKLPPRVHRWASFRMGKQGSRFRPRSSSGGTGLPARRRASRRVGRTHAAC